MPKPIVDGADAPELVSEHGAGQNTHLPGPPKAAPVVPHPDAIDAYLKWWAWGIAHRGQIAYTEDLSIRLEGERDKPGTLPFGADCSGLTYVFADWAGLRLPFNGSGNTDSLMSQCGFVTATHALPGDLAIFGRYEHLTGTSHVVTLLEKLPNGDWDCGSHGSKTNPCHHVTLSAEAAYQASAGFPQVNYRRIPR